MKYFPFLVFCMSLLLISCAASREQRLLRKHNNALTRAAYSDLSADYKMDVLVDDMLDMMHESLDYANVKQGGEYIGKYYAQNEDAINHIVDEYGAAFESKSITGILGSVMKMASDDKIKRAAELVPRFARKYKQYAFLAKTVFKPLGWLNELGIIF